MRKYWTIVRQCGSQTVHLSVLFIYCAPRDAALAEQRQLSGQLLMQLTDIVLAFVRFLQKMCASGATAD